MDVKIENTSTIFQLAFGVNAVATLLVNEYRKNADRLIDASISKLLNSAKVDLSDWKIKQIISEAIIKLYPAYNWLRITILCCIIISILSMIYCLNKLIDAAAGIDNANQSLVPRDSLSNAATILIFVFPFMYFIAVTVIDGFSRVLGYKIQNMTTDQLDGFVEQINQEIIAYRGAEEKFDYNNLKLKIFVKKISYYIKNVISFCRSPFTYHKKESRYDELESLLNELKSRETVRKNDSGDRS